MSKLIIASVLGLILAAQKSDNLSAHRVLVIEDENERLRRENADLQDPEVRDLLNAVVSNALSSPSHLAEQGPLIQLSDNPLNLPAGQMELRVRDLEKRITAGKPESGSTASEPAPPEAPKSDTPPQTPAVPGSGSSGDPANPSQPDDPVESKPEESEKSSPPTA